MDQSSARYPVSSIIERREEPPDSLGKEAVEVSWAVGNEHFQSCLKSSQLEGKRGSMSEGRVAIYVVEDGERKRTDENVYSGAV